MFTDDHLLTHSALLRAIPLWPFILFYQNQKKQVAYSNRCASTSGIS